MSANEMVVALNALFLAPAALAGAVAAVMTVKLCGALLTRSAHHAR